MIHINRTRCEYNVLNFRTILYLAVVTLLMICVWTVWPCGAENLWSNSSVFAPLSKTTELSKLKLKYILLWDQNSPDPLRYFRMEQKAFHKYNCSITNCYVTENRNYFGGDLKKFDSILINGRSINGLNHKNVPKRYPHQKVVYLNQESSSNYPVCNEIFNNYFNWTSTYKLNSDFPLPYIMIKNKKGDIIGPRQNMEWVKEMKEVDETFSRTLRSKTKAAAWFVSHCGVSSGRNEFVKNLQKELDKFKLKIDIYGTCGTLKCTNKNNECSNMLRKDYYFYMALENSFAEDYVTEKPLHGILNNVVPIVFGGGNYSRFLPPGSYIDGRAYCPVKLASMMNDLINSPERYRQYFRWQSYYTYSNPGPARGVCQLCEMLNSEEQFRNVTVYKDFRSWWFDYDYKKICGLFAPTRL